MVENEIFFEISSMIKEHPGSYEVKKRAAGYVAGLYPVGRIEETILTNTTMLPFNKEREDFVLFDSGYYSEEDVLVIEMQFKDCGKIISHVYPTMAAKKFTEEQKNDLRVLGALFQFYVGHNKIMTSLEMATTNNHMTGLPNPKGYIIRCMEIAKKGDIKQYDSCYFNIKGFGLANNMFGPVEGDNIIKRYAKDLSEFIEEDEVVGHLGGDNFVALIKRSRMDDFIDFILNYTGYGLKNEKRKEIKFGASIGIAPLNIETSRPMDIISEAALAFGYARATKQEIVVLDENLTGKLYKKKVIEETFETALEDGEFVPFYQPKVDIRTGKIVGAEALARWVKPDHVIKPAEFIPVLEENGNITVLDFYIFEEVCKDIAKWAKQGNETVPVSVNFSRKHLDDDNLADRINQIISRYDVARDMVVVEITETADYDEKELMTNFLDKMQIYDIKTSIDDFGSGYSSLGVLRDFAVNEIKIDRSFVDREEFSNRDSVIVGSIVNMAKDLGLSVITEGIETDVQLDFLRSLDCYFVQGFYFDKPLPKKKFEERLLNDGYKIKN